MHVRLAHADDAPEIHALMLATFTPFQDQYTPACFDATVLDPPRIQERMAEGPVWVVEDEGGRMIGTVGAVQDARGLYVRGLAVHPDSRRQGTGRRLMAVVEGYADAVEAPCMWLSTTRFLDASQDLYRSFGFVDAEGPADLHGTPLVSFQKDL